MASEETTLTASSEQSEDSAEQQSAASENNQIENSAQTNAGTSGNPIEPDADNANTNQPASGFETEATAPELAAMDEVHSAIQPETSSGDNAQTNGETGENVSDTTVTDIGANVDSAAQDAGSANAAASGDAASGDAAGGQADAEQPKKENVVVRKLKLNPNAKPPAQSQSQSSASATGGATAAASAPQQNQQPQTAPLAAAQQRPAAAAATARSAEDFGANAGDEGAGDSMDFGAILQQFEQEQQEAQARFSVGTLVEGTVVGVSDRGVLIDFGYKSEGIVPQAEFLQDGQMTVSQGDTTEVVVKRLDTPEGLPELSRAEAIKQRTWDDLERASQDGTPVKGRVIDKVKGGLSVDINGIEAFLPGSQIESRPPRTLDGYQGQEIEARVIKFSRKRGNVVLSRKVLLDEVSGAQKAQTMQNIAEGFIVEGKIKSMTEYGAFVDLGGIDGLLHVTDMSWGKLDKPSDMFKVGDEAQVKVLKIDRDKERISLGYKQLIPNPWQSIEERYEIGSRHHGKVTSITDYGAFVELEPGVEGLVHVSEMTWSKRAKHPNKVVRVGQDIDVQVLRIDQKDRRVSLGMRQVMSNPWETIYERYPIGTRVRGRVRNMTDFGAFVELEEGVDGLVHLSDITHSKKIKHPSEVLKKNQEVDAMVTGINVEGRRMSLSMKELQPSAWEAFVATHKPGDIVHGKISRFANFGVFVELADELEGLCHISELSDERIEKPEKVFQIGQELDFKILRIEPDVQKIGLSHRAVGKEDEPQVDTKNYSSEAKSGMASLGELANLRNLRGDE